MPHTFTANNKEQQDWVTLDPDTYEAQFTRYEDYSHPEYGPGLKLCFFVDYVDEKGVPKVADVSGLASLPKNGMALGLKSKLRAWIEALRGSKLADGEAIDLDSLLERRCRLVLDIKEGALRDDGTRPQFNRIDKILPLRKKAVVAAAARPAAVAAGGAGKDEDLI